MTVKVVPYEHKTHIAHCYTHENQSSEDIAKQYNVSRRTINRVLVEMGVARTPKRKPKVKMTSVAVPLYSVQPELPITMVEPTFMDKMKEFFKSIFSTKQQQSNVQAIK